VSADVFDRAQLGTNPFAVLDVTARDTRERIIEAAEDRALVVDSDACTEASAILTNPRRRFEAELGWFPGVAPSTARRALQARDLAEIEALPINGLAMANALLGGALRSPPASLVQLTGFLATIAKAIDGVTLESVLRDVNEDRGISGFPPFSSNETAEEMLRDRNQLWRSAVLSLLGRLPTTLMAEGLYRALERMVADNQMPRFLHEVIDDYALRVQPFIQDETNGATRLVEKARSVAGDRPQALSPLIDGLAALLEAWERFTRPIQLSMTTLGRTDEDGERLGIMIRELAVDLYNEHDLADEARRITALLASHFAALPRLMAKVAQDAQALEGFAAEAEKRDAEIAYAAEIGTFKKTRLAINSTTLEWKGEKYAVNRIRSARWGAIRRSVNGIPQGTDYLIAWSDGERTATIDFGNGAIYEAFVERLWRVLAKPMLSTLVEGLRSGREYDFGGAVIRDDGVTLPSTKFFGDQPTRFNWGEVTIGTANGSFVINGPAKAKASVSLSFRDVPNVHFLETLVREAFKNGHTQLSNAFS
jgi:hypothetical protein